MCLGLNDKFKFSGIKDKLLPFPTLLCHNFAHFYSSRKSDVPKAVEKTRFLKGSLPTPPPTTSTTLLSAMISSH